MKICYKPVEGIIDFRKIYVDGVFYANLRITTDGSVYTCIKHPNINLAKLFEDASKNEIGFFSAMELNISLGKGE